MCGILISGEGRIYLFVTHADALVKSIRKLWYNGNSQVAEIFHLW